METTTCRSCGRDVAWARTVTGRRMPVDARPAAVYTLREQGIELFADRALPDERIHISHFSSCPNAGAWSRKVIV